MQAASFAAASSNKSSLDRGDVYGRGDDFDAARGYEAPPTSRLGSARIKINVRGMVFETYEETLAQYPQTLLGNPKKRLHYLNPLSGEYCFDRNKFLFDSILFFYQSHGILAFPEDIPKECFIEEIRFFQLQEVDERIKKEIDPPEKEAAKPVVLSDSAIKRKIWDLFEHPDSSVMADLLAKLSVIIIIISTVTFCLETMESLRYDVVNVCVNESVSLRNNSSTAHASSIETNYPKGCFVDKQYELWHTIEAVYVAWFTFEYLVRLFSSPQRCKFVKSAMGMVDLLAIVPYYITLITRGNVSAIPVLGIIRLLRIIRLLKLSRYSRGLKNLAKTLILSGSDLPSMFAVMIINVVLFSSVIFHVENEIPESDFKSIPDAFWFSVITMTTVGYGDQVPKGLLGKLVATLCAVSGIVILFCFPTPVLLSHFEEVMYGDKDKEKDDDKKIKKQEKPVCENKIYAIKEEDEKGLFEERDNNLNSFAVP
ncbi:potassium voltage-gated channel subfamily A member 2-like [Actinia tenebrosa]|uniref:Potassium voltage-gated channel subfamily A member 2-like n=1 Tax=Actinia tenebrosa TaxID=6105 RepID=A0A6P8HTJ5_ACTTE|nr:potassium voltage-gated channel subfamily A member 2-like [Actinia tenebrosa]XP_031558733.1 potassium voltage-gated channel subfamily A member 2-like [Actinia tenebrosa]XP_031558734.1 potassium voltage-gated channel subfamily A member 2-like [Actinia tenebrosa]XP_031558735.1 potassium voltage-gated channel subfamily A member 2-like [Actinia tenebrosa]XP_031558736.1 potassium voltage-gated channel subfamily A member 2-like [Actinia tenebrosa]